MPELGKRAALIFLEGLRQGQVLQQLVHDADPSPENKAKLETIQKAIETMEGHIAKMPDDMPRPPVRPRLPEIVLPPPARTGAYDPIKAAADRAEQRSAQQRKKGQP